MKTIGDTYPQPFSKAERFWRDVLRGFKAPLKLPDLSDSSASRRSQEVRLSSRKTSALTTFAQNQQLTINTLIQGAWALFLSRYSGETDILFGATRACRQAAFEDRSPVVGLSLNTVPIRVSVPPKASVLSWLKELQAQWFAMEEYESTPLVQVREWSEVPQELPLFETLVMLENDGLDPKLQQQGGKGKNGKFELSELDDYLLILSAHTGPDLLLNIDYERSRFGDGAIARMLGHLETVLTSIITEPEQCLAHVPLLTASERHQLLVEWNQTQTDYPRDKCIHELFEKQVERTPDAVAVVFEKQQLTYQELNCRANQLAHHLKKLGVGSEVLVGVCLERSLKIIIGLLAILKAGGAYLPLDFGYPRERLAFMLDDAQVPVLLTQQSLLEKLPEHQAKVVCLDTDWETVERERESNLTSSVTADNLAYVMYTSGSTGKPKGVCAVHRGVVRLVQETHYVNLSSEEVFLQLASISFDASTFEIWGSLLNGAKLVLFFSDKPSLEELGQTIREHQITTLWLTAGLFHLMVDKRLEDLKPLRQLLAGGDVLSVPHVQRVLQNLDNCQLINGYGPTENTTFTCCYPISKSDRLINSVPIGRPIASTQVYLLDDYLQPVPIGVSGELYVGGDGLARGYLNRPELTQEKFICNAFSGSRGAGEQGSRGRKEDEFSHPERLYKTGDLARYLPDGNIEFLGRIDNQVKIRGFRVELGEIEAVLSQHPTVRETVVIAREDIAGDKRLVAYIVPDPIQNPKPPRTERSEEQRKIQNQLRHFLKEKLPDYMIPSAFVLLESFPLTPNGKIDRRSLPIPDYHREGMSLAPRTPIEEILANIWSEVLKVEPIGIHDNFFELGGHSLLATQVISRLREAFSVELPLRSLFEAPTIAQLAQEIISSRQSDRPSPIPPIERSHREGSLPLSFAQQRLWFLDQLTPNNSTYNLCYGFRLQGALNLGALEQSLGEIAQRHEVLRTTFPSIDGQATQVISSLHPLILPVINLQQLPPPQQEVTAQGLIEEEAQRPFDLVHGPLLRFQLLRFNEQDHLLLLNIHHIVFDGWSFHVLFEELSLLYEAFSGGKPSPLAEPTIQYVDFALWQRQWLVREVLEAQLDYWKQQLRGSLHLLQLPTDRPRPPIQTYEGASYSLIFDQDLTAALKTLGHQEGVTLFMTLLAAFKILLYRYSGQEDIIIGSPIAGRNRSEIEGLIGFFVNSLALRTDLGGNPSFRELLRRVRKVALGAYAHQDFPFEKLVEELHPERRLSYHPLFQVMFALQNTPQEQLELPGLTIVEQEIENTTAKFDLTLSLWETETGLTGKLEYNRTLFESGTIERMIGHFQTLLEALIVNPEQRISQLPLLTEEEKHKLLVEWNQTETDYPRDKCIHQVFEKQVEKTPDAVAIVFGEEKLTYRQLNAKANQLAHYLQKLGVKPETLVGICVERSREMVVGLLGILKAGGAYLPLDPAYPTERLAFMLEDAQVSILLTQQSLLEKLLVHRGIVFCLDRDEANIQQESPENLTSSVRTDNLAYVIYTSGSTGKPKGVCAIHRGVVRLVRGTNYAHFSATEVFLQLAPISFDASTFEIWGSLLNGAKLVLFPKDKPSLAELGQALKHHQITTLWLTAGLFHLMVDEQLEDLKLLRQLFAGGDVLSVPHVQKVLSYLENCQLINGYGPTENTTFTCCYSLTQPDGLVNSVPIGRPIANTQVYILDPRLQPVPIGIPGELYIGGEGLARGYLNRPELTEAKFIPNLFDNSKFKIQNSKDNRLYKTGDLARYLPDGNIEFLGRIDHQVKIRGFRIELGEIEAVLSQHPTVRETVVIAREDIAGDKRLVAYIVPDPIQNPKLPRTEQSEEQRKIQNQLRHFLKEKLPDYMIPSAFVLLEALPLNPNGKIDRRALPTPERQLNQETEFIPPQTPIQEIVAAIWSQILGTPVSIHDNFFELGGHSLLATQVISRLQKALDLQLPLRTLFEAPTVAELGECIETIHWARKPLPFHNTYTSDNCEEGEL